MKAPVLLPRVADWPERLAELVELRRHTPFAWGSNDCATFAADAVLATTGVEYLGVLRGAWRTGQQADAYLQQQHGLAAAVSARLGRPRRNAHQVVRGAVVCAAIPLPTLGVLLGSTWCAPGQAGLVFRPASEVRLAWGY